MKHTFTSPHVYQFRVVVQGISPLIWRRILVRSDMSLALLHATLQIVFAWSDVHLHCFRIHGKEYGSTRPSGPSFDADPRQVPLAALGLHRGERIPYVYNFIDHWVCELRLETLLPLSPRCFYPLCTGGKRAAPPEDCGGPWAYMQLLDRHHVPLEAMSIITTALERLQQADEQTRIRQIIGNPETFREAVEQLDDYCQFQPDHFARHDVNAQLRALAPQEGAPP